MRDSIDLGMKMQAAIMQEISERTAVHQEEMRLMRVAAADSVAAGAMSPMPLALLALGDSWFDYPLSGNSVSFESTDILAQLASLGTINPMILNVSHFGDATRDELALPKQQRLRGALQDPANRDPAEFQTRFSFRAAEMM